MPALQRRDAELLVHLRRQVDDDQPVDAGGDAHRPGSGRRRRCRSGCSSPSARSASRRRRRGIRAAIASVFASVWPPFSARRPAAWIAGPSAIGSENGMPSSMMSAPASGSAFMIAERGVVVRVAAHEIGDERRAAFGLRAWRSGGRCGWSCIRSPCPASWPTVMHVLVAAAGEVDDDDLVLAHRRRELDHMGDGMRRIPAPG